MRVSIRMRPYRQESMRNALLHVEGLTASVDDEGLREDQSYHARQIQYEQGKPPRQDIDTLIWMGGDQNHTRFQRVDTRHEEHDLVKGCCVYPTRSSFGADPSVQENGCSHLRTHPCVRGRRAA